MRKTSDQAYAQAFVETISEAPASEHGKVLQRFLKLLQENGDWPRASRIAAAAETAWRRRNERPLVTVESPRALTSTQLAKLKESLKHAALPRDFDVKEQLRPELLAGVRVTVDEERQLDASLQHLLSTVLARTS